MSVIEAAAKQQEALQDALLAERAADLRDIGRRVLAQLCGVQSVQEPSEPYILVMEEVGPSDVARLTRPALPAFSPPEVAPPLTVPSSLAPWAFRPWSVLALRYYCSTPARRFCSMASAVACMSTPTPPPCNGPPWSATAANSACKLLRPNAMKRR